MHLEVRDLELLDALAAHPRLGEAAGALGVSVSAVSHHLTSLERRLGVALWRRFDPREPLTDEARRVCQRAQVALEALRRAESMVRNEANGTSVAVRLGMSGSTASAWVAPALKELRRHSPDLLLDLIQPSSTSPLSCLLAGRLDALIAPTSVCGEWPYRSEICWSEDIVVAASGHPWGSRPHVDVQELAGEALLIHDPGDLETLRRLVQPRNVRSVALADAALSLVASGAGVTVIPEWALGSCMCRRLRRYRLSAVGVGRSWSLAMSESFIGSPLAAVLLDALRTALWAPGATACPADDSAVKLPAVAAEPLDSGRARLALSDAGDPPRSQKIRPGTGPRVSCRIL